MRPRLLASAIVAASALAFTPAAALAGESHFFSTERGPLPDWSSGYTRANVTVEFLSKKTYDVQGWIEDVCPKDGNGAYLYVRQPPIPGQEAAKDAGGCGDGKKHFDPAPVKLGVDVPALTVWLCERDADKNTGTRYTNYCTPYSFDNWRM